MRSIPRRDPRRDMTPAQRTRSPLLSYPVGTMLDSIYKTWRWPRVVGRVEHDPKNPLEYAKIWRIAQQAAAAGEKPVKFGTCSAQVLAFFLDSHTPDYDLDDKRQLIWDMAEAMNNAVDAARGIKDEADRVRALAVVAPYLPAALKVQAVRDALSAARAIPGEAVLVSRPEPTLAPHLFEALSP